MLSRRRRVDRPDTGTQISSRAISALPSQQSTTVEINERQEEVFSGDVKLAKNLLKRDSTEGWRFQIIND